MGGATGTVMLLRHVWGMSRENFCFGVAYIDVTSVIKMAAYYVYMALVSNGLSMFTRLA